MSVTRRKLAEGELSFCEKIIESIRKTLGYSEDNWNNLRELQYDVEMAFLEGLRIGGGGENHRLEA